MSNIIYGDINLDPLLRAQKKFKQYSRNLTDEQYQAGAIQSFEWCYELSWKFMRKVLIKNDIEAEVKKDIFRQAARIGLIESPEAWFKFNELRNLTSHTYDEDESNKVVKALPEFDKALDQLIEKLQEQPQS